VKIGVLLSGGVDSSTALVLLKEKYPDAEITAYYLKIWLEDELSFLGSCPWEEDLSYARAVCDLTDVPLKVVNLQKEYWEKVVSYTVSELKAGRTPSPDIFCNTRIKFGAFLDKVSESLDKIASGHYAVVTNENDGLYYIKRSPDPVKDQTYFLSHLTQKQASLVMFPIGSMLKDDVRQAAEKWNVPSKNRKDSQGICFLGKIKYPDFVRHYLGEKEGKIVDLETGRILGKHNGTWFYTIGQRSGLGLSGGPWYVVKKDRENNVVFVAGTPAAITAARSEFTVINPSWITKEPEEGPVMLKLRHGPKILRAEISKLENTVDGNSYTDRFSGQRFRVVMEQPDRGVAPGQFAVFYDKDICLGGAMIEEEK